jgi:hypothetical protein
MGWLISLAAGIGALLMLDRGDRRGDVAASALVGLALASSGLGLPIAAGVLVDVLWGRRQWRAVWIAAAPLAVYAVWWLAYQDTGIMRQNIALAPGFAADAAAGALAALTGLTEIRPDANGILADAGGGLGWGRPLAVLAASALAWRLLALRPVPARVLALLAIPVAFWLLTGLQRAHVGSPEASRYLYVGGVFILLLAVEAARGVVVPRVVPVALAAAVGLAVISNLGDLRAGARYLRIQDAVERADLAALELSRAGLPPGYVAARFPGTPFISIGARAYLAAAKADGSPADTPAELAAAPEPARQNADAELVNLRRVAVSAGAPPPAGAAPAVDTTAGGTATRRGACVRFRAAAVTSSADGPELQLAVPAGGVRITAAGGPVTLAARRFGVGFAEPPLATVAPGATAGVRVAHDDVAQPWHLSLRPQSSVNACGLG